MALENDPYRNPYFRPHRDRELDGFRYADGSRIHRGDPVVVDGAPLTVIGFDPAHDGIIAAGPGGVMTVRTADVEKPGQRSAEIIE